VEYDGNSLTQQNGPRYFMLAKRLQRRQPDIEDLSQHRDVQHLFRRVVIEQIGFRHPCQLGDLLQTGTVDAKLREGLQRRRQNRLFLGAHRSRPFTRALHCAFCHVLTPFKLPTA
jgi:hypothetical protein